MSDGGIGFGRRVEELIGSDDFLTKIEWTDAALAKAADAGFASFWRAWTREIAKRGDTKGRHKRSESRATKWPWTDAARHPAAKVLSLIEREDWSGLSRWAGKQLGAEGAWRDERTESELLVLADWLWNAPKLDAEIAWPIWQLVVTRAIELSAYLTEPLSCDISSDRRLLVTGELPWLLGHVFADIDGVTDFKQLGQQSLRNELIELTDGDGTPSASLLPRLPQWLASLIRSFEVGEIVKEPLLEGEPQYRLEDLITKSVMLLDHHGHLMVADLAEPGPHRHQVTGTVAMLSRAAELLELDELSLAAESLRFRRYLATHGAKKPFRSSTFAMTPEERLIVTDTDLPAVQSDWAGWACLRNWWHPTANMAIVRFDSEPVQLQIALLGVPVIDGVWDLQVAIDGKRLKLAQPWKCSCWTSDTDMDYVELQLDVPDGPMICRQICLSRKDRFLVMADAVTKTGNHRIDLTSRWPLASRVRSRPGTDTRELRLTSGHLKARCYPLALPDDRALSTLGEFDCGREMRSEPVGLRLTQVASREAVYAPLVIDWHPDRQRLDAEWRTLTVTEEGQKVAPWQAAGHRLRVGDLHLIVYRSLCPTVDQRAVLGLHTEQESVIAQFHEKGYVLPIVSVDA